MAKPADASISDMDGSEALPRKNGELVFEAPWEGRAFGLAVTLNERGIYEWPAFRDQLVAQIAEAEAKGIQSTYYERWAASLERLAISRGLVTPEELEARAEEYEHGQREEDWE